MINERHFQSVSKPASLAPVDAAEWVVRLHSDQILRDEDGRFEAWEQANPAHKKEFEIYEGYWQSIGNLANDPEAVSFLMEPYSDRPRLWMRPKVWAATAVGAMAACVAMFMLLQPLPDSQTYQTARGERRDFILDDGSLIALNTNSELRVSFSKNERHVFLEEGEFHVRVAKDATRPFRVFVDDREVRAVGTEFDVYRDNEDNKTHVTLNEGVVAIYDIDARRSFAGFSSVSLSSEKPAVVMESGHHAVLVPNEPPAISAVDSDRFNAWHAGIVSFEGVALKDAIKEVNRYVKRQIILGDPGIANLRINGIFHINELDKFADKLTTLYNIRIERKDETSTVVIAG